MANFTGQPISSSYQRVLQIDGGVIQDGLGNTVNATISSLTGSFSGSLTGITTTASYYQETDPIFTAVSGTFTTTSSFNSFTSSYYIDSASIVVEFDGLAEADGQTLELDTINNVVLLKETVAAPASGTRTFLGNIGVELNLSVSGAVFLNTSSLPSSDPLVTGQLWRSGSFLMVSLG
jgi:hypothetical protein